MLKILIYQTPFKKNLCGVFLQFGVVYDGELGEVDLRVILHASPFFESIHPKLDCHNAVVNVVAKISLKGYGYALKFYFVVLVKLLKELCLEFIFCLLAYYPMLTGVEGIQRGYFAYLKAYSHIGQRSGGQARGYA